MLAHGSNFILPMIVEYTVVRPQGSEPGMQFRF